MTVTGPTVLIVDSAFHGRRLPVGWVAIEQRVVKIELAA
jgi:hypothetical protein